MRPAGSHRAPEGTRQPMPASLVRAVRRTSIGLLVAVIAVATLLVQPADAHSGPAKPRLSGYVALGDSYASGEGLTPFEPGTEGAGECHRSATQSYPELLARSSHRQFRKLDSVACSGAITADLVATRPGTTRPAQLTALNARTKTITLTVGGNDAGFSVIFGDCVYSPDPALAAALPGRPGCGDRNDALVSTRIAALAGGRRAPVVSGVLPLPTALKQIDAVAPRATIYLTGYPSMFGKRIHQAAGCRVSDQAPLYVATKDAAWIRAKAAELNSAIRSAAVRARRQGVDVRYVDVASAFSKHNLCDKRSPWINGVLLTSLNPPQLSAATFHPTARGQQAYAKAVSRRAR